MAKGKNAAALFEVINKDRRPGAKAALRTPAWWSKNKPVATADSATPRAAGAAPAPLAPAGTGSKFQLTSTSMMLAAAGIVIGFLLAIFATRGGDRPTISPQTTDELRAGPANPDVMQVKRGEAGLTPLPPRDGKATKTNAPAPGPALFNDADAGKQAPPPTPAAAFNGKRTVGLNYVIIQSYPETKMAEDARDILAKDGVSTTIVKGLRGMNPSYFIVVGTDGFARIHSGDFEGYIKKVQQISDQFAKRKSFKAFTPFGYKWEPSDP